MSEKIVPLHGFGGGGVPLSFKVVGGVTQPTNPTENTIWVNTDAAITSWHFGAEEPNVYNIQQVNPTDPWNLVAPHSLRAGDIISFTIPATVTSTYEAIRIHDGITGKTYCVRESDGRALSAWSAGTKVSVMISDEIYKVGEWSGDGTARLLAWGSYYHKEGTVWIETGTASPVAFNALKKNGIQVYPISAKQYVGGAWVDKTAKSYQNGEWVNWVVYVVQSGVAVKDFSGTIREPSSELSVLTPQNGYLKWYISAARTGGPATKNPIDVSNYTKLTFKCNIVGLTTGANSAIVVGLSKTINNSNHDAVVSAVVYSSRVTTTGEHTIECDISGATGEYYLTAYHHAGNSGTTTVNIYDFYLS